MPAPVGFLSTRDKNSKIVFAMLFSFQLIMGPGLFLRVKAFQYREQWRTIRCYYGKPRFALADLMLGVSVFFFNPYRTCRKFLQKKNESWIHAYGETPLRLFEKLASAAKLTHKDTFVELGSGRGKLCFWAALFIGCKVDGIEWVPSFVRLSTFISWLFSISARFHLQSIFNVDLSKATAVYVYAIHLSEKYMQELAIQCERMAKDSALIIIGEPIASKLFTIEEVHKALFPWGETEAYIQRRT